MTAKKKPTNERTSPQIARIASKVLRLGKATDKEAVALAPSCLTQAAGRA